MLPLRKRGSALPARLAVAPPLDDAGKKTVTEALQEIHERIDPVTINGVLAAGLAAQFMARAEVGDPRAVFFEGDSGQVGVFSVDAGTLLVVFRKPSTTTGMFNVAAKQALALLQGAIAGQR